MISIIKITTIFLLGLLVIGCSPSETNIAEPDLNQFEKEHTEEMERIKEELDRADSLFNNLGEHNETIDKLREFVDADTIR